MDTTTTVVVLQKVTSCTQQFWISKFQFQECYRGQIEAQKGGFRTSDLQAVAEGEDFGVVWRPVEDVSLIKTWDFEC